MLRRDAFSVSRKSAIKTRSSPSVEDGDGEAFFQNLALRKEMLCLHRLYECSLRRWIDSALVALRSHLKSTRCCRAMQRHVFPSLNSSWSKETQPRCTRLIRWRSQGWGKRKEGGWKWQVEWEHHRAREGMGIKWSRSNPAMAKSRPSFRALGADSHRVCMGTPDLLTRGGRVLQLLS